MKKNTKKKIAIIASTFVLLIAIVLVLAGNYFYDIALNPNTNKDFLNNAGTMKTNQTAAEQLKTKNKQDELALWAKSIYTKWNMSSFDGLNLNAYYYETEEPSHRYAIVVHGYMGKSLDMISSSHSFYERGYNVLTPDCRGLGDSEGDYIGMGWDDRLDIIGWINQIIEKDPDAEIVLYGVSMGGATVMMVSGEELPPNVKCIIEDCGYTSVEEIFRYQLKSLFGLPSFPILPISNIVTQIRAGYSFKEASAIRQVAKSKIPILFIHGDADRFVPFSMLQEVYDAATCEKEMYVVEGAAHGDSADKAEDNYWKCVFDFIDKY